MSVAELASTATTQAARAHARSQAGTMTDSMPFVPASTFPCPPAEAGDLTWAETVAGGRYTSKVVARGTRLRLTDVEGSACAHLLLFNADQPWERLNAADTVKVPWQAYLSEGHPLLSDQGRVLATVLADTSGSHDLLCGTTTKRSNTEKYGDGSLHGPAAAGFELFTVAAAKHGLSPRDLPPSISLFHGIRVAADGTLESVGNSGPGASVDLLIHIPAIVLLANTAHRLDPAPEFTTTNLQIVAWDGLQDLDHVPNSDPEYLRAVANTNDYLTARGLK
ncbi:urea amidolyase associated protein UAAP1 [Hoyosella subflava]|uniref:Urea carboxylase-associated protein 2 n=1 Tax=Hoyosella subflava (strain DSM 45089 / JCM 17490 / NBRC 109087 / DQS3-9A1) TaxID=443218 RepID=F6EQA4_HOYSD|nr:urea amidolyase associated protein UAAP1 [Hoyosella subflava]AEF39527.1 Urea carboxylase-associated protein 2 [Hoyosella subflava DQS3-9A1]